MEMGERGEGGHWNPGIPPSTVPPPPGQENPWPIPVECIMNGMLPQAEAHSHLSMFFRHRMSHSANAMHFVPSSQIINNSHMHENAIGLNVPQHSMVDTEPSSISMSIPDQPSSVQDSQPMSSLMSGRHVSVLDDSEGCSEDDDEDEVTDEEMGHSVQGYVHPHSQQMNAMHSHTHSITCEEESLPACRQHSQQISSIGNDVAIMGGLEETPCHQKNMLPTGINHVHDHENDLSPSINEGHPLNSNPISAIPMITGNPMLMPEESEDLRNRPSVETSIHTTSMNNDVNFSNNGHSVHGKMYVEDRVVFHLKQWTDSGFGDFVSCREDAQKNQMYRCAVCRSSNNGDHQKDHRHSVRGMILSYGDRIIVELYPEHSFVHSENANPPEHLDPKQAMHMENSKPDHSLPSVSVSYLGHPHVPHPNDQDNMNEMIVRTEETDAAITINKPSAEDGWWESFDSNRQDGNRITNSPLSQSQDDMTLSETHRSCVIDKINAQHYHDSQTDHAEVKVTNSSVQSGQNQYNLNKKSSQDDSHSPLGDYLRNTRSEGDDSDNSQHDLLTIANESKPPSPSISPNAGIASNLNLSSKYLQNKLPPVKSPNADLSLEATESVSKISTNNENYNQSDPRDISSGTLLKSKSKSSKSKSREKYPCPSCSKSFCLKSALKQHLEEKHESENPLKCKKCKLQFTDDRRFQRHSCTLSVEAIKNKLQKTNKVVVGKTFISKVDKGEESKAYEQYEENSDIRKDNTSNKSELGSLNLKQVLLEKALGKGKSSSSDKKSKILALTPESQTEKGRKRKNTPTETETERKRKKSNNFLKQPLSKKPEEIRSQSINMKSSKSPKYKFASKSDEENLAQDQELEDDDDYESQTRYLSTANKQNCSDNNKNGSIIEKLIDGKKKDFNCKQCGKTFTNERRLLNHVSSHMKHEKVSQCEKCGKQFARKDKLLRHMYVHLEEKSFSCDICNKRFSRRDKLSDHYLSHQTEQVFDCPSCEKQFVRPDILKQHIKNHLTGNKHQCRECLRFVTGKDRLVQHMKRHDHAKAQGETLLCPLCTKYFIQRQSLKAHIKKFHPDALEQIRQLDACDSKELAADREGAVRRMSESTSSTDDPVSNDAGYVLEPPSKLSTICLVLDDVMSNNKSKSNDKLRPFKCKVCQQTFARKQSLQKHSEIKHSTSALFKLKGMEKALETKTQTGSEIEKQTALTASRLETNPSGNKQKNGSWKKSKSTSTSNSKSKSSGNKNETTSKTSKTGPPMVTVSTSARPSDAVENSSDFQVTVRPISIQQPHRSLQQQLPVPLAVPLPSCSSLTHNLSFEHMHQPQPNSSNSNGIHGQQTHLNVYSHLALAAASMAGRSFPVNNCSVSGTGSIMSSLSASMDNSGHQQLSSVDLMNAQHHPLHQINISGNNPYSASPYIINYGGSPYEHQ